MTLPNLAITDHPRFGYRGVLLDVGRHYFPVTSIKKMLDLAAEYKLNRFHWHLTDNEGWRIEIKRYPQLTAGSSGYYTQREIRDIVAYARARFITVIPEIEMPGHSGAATAAYPELTCSPPDYANVLCPSEEAFTFVQNVLQEVITLFPSAYVHIGSDEVDKESWRQSARAQDIMKREGLRNEDELQSWFVQRVSRFLTGRGKQTIGWDEILEGGLAPDTIVMSWRGESGGIEAARQKHAVIMSPTDYCYFDYYQGDPAREPEAIGGFIPLEKAYEYEPVPQELSADEQRYVLGAQANLWTEYVATPEHLEYMLFPRLLAFSETVWSPIAGKRYEDFQGRLTQQLTRLARQNVQFRIPEPAGLKDFYTATDSHARIDLTSLVAGSRIHYTLDGSLPTDSSSRYHAPFPIPLEPEQKKSLNVMVVAPDGRRSLAYEAKFLRSTYREAAQHLNPQPGLAHAVYEGTFATVQAIEQGTPSGRRITTSFDPQQAGRPFDFGMTFDGYVKVPADGYYQFVLEADDGAILQIGNQVVIDNDGNHAPRLLDGHVPLRAGFHKLSLRYFQARGGMTLRISWGISGGDLRPLDASALFH
jgi:hexosaminidase